jgi:putative FmdB family regulatory protein
MPIYEFYCPQCHMVFNFYSRTINTDKIPACPKCDRAKLERQMSSFSVLHGQKEDQENGLPDIDADMTGLELGSGMEEALRRMEAGEDPEQIEAEMGDLLEEDPLVPQNQRKSGPRKQPPRKDDTLYEL